MAPPACPPLSFGPFVLDIPNARLTRHGLSVALAPKALAVLGCLARRPGNLVTKDELLDAVWGRRFVSEGVIKTAVSELRHALGDDPKRPDWIETVPRHGYRFIGGAGPASPAAALTDVSVLPQQFVPPSQVRPQRQRQTRPQTQQDMPAHAAESARVPTPTARTGSPTPTAPPVQTLTQPPWPAGELPLVGREHELTALAVAWQRTQAGQRVLMLVAGEPGVGKTSLLTHFVAAVGEGLVMIGQCVEAYGSDEPYLPVLEALGQLCATDTAMVAAVRRYAPTWLVQLPWLVTDDDRVRLQREVSGATQDRMLREMGALLDHLAQDQPLLLVLEDLHWCDPATLRLLDTLARRRNPAQLMLLGSYRPADVAIAKHPFADLRREWQLHRLCDELPLSGLTQDQLATLLLHRFGEPAFDPAFLAALHEHTDGLPLFVQGVLDELVDQGVIERRDGQGWALLALPVRSLPVPASLSGVIDKQFVRLPTQTRVLLETAALAAPQFQHIQIAEALDLNPHAVRETLEDLLRRQIWLRPASAQELPDGRWATCCTFEHALIRKTLAQRVSPSLAVERHRRLADSLEHSWRTRLDEIAGELVMHAEQGHQHLRAARYAALAARNALQRRASREALSMAQRGLDQIEHLDVIDRRDVELPLLALRITGVLLTDGLSSPAARPLVAQALQLVQDLPAVPDTVALWQVALLVHLTGRLPGTTELARRFAERAQAGGDAMCLAAAHNAVGIDHLHAGRIEAARARLGAGLADIQTAAHAASPRAVVGYLLRDPGIEAHSYLVLVEAIAGRLARSAQHHAEVDAMLARGTDLITEGLSRWFQVYALYFQRDAQGMRRVGEPVVRLLEARQVSPGLQPHRMAQGWALAALGQPAQGAAMARDALARYREQGSRQDLVGLHGMVADAVRLAGDVAGVREVVAQGMACCDDLGDHFALSELLRLQAWTLLADDAHSVQAETLLRQAVALARSQHAALIQALVWTDLAPLLRARGHVHEAGEGTLELLTVLGPHARCPATDKLRSAA